MTSANMKYLCNSLDHVLDMTAHCVNGGQLLAFTKPLDDLQLILAVHDYINRHMLETADQDSSGSLHCDLSGLHLNIHWKMNKFQIRKGTEDDSIILPLFIQMRLAAKLTTTELLPLKPFNLDIIKHFVKEGVSDDNFSHRNNML